MSFDKTTYDKEFTKANYYTLTVRLSKVKDNDIIDHLLDVQKTGYASKQSYIKSLIRKELHKRY